MKDWQNIKIENLCDSENTFVQTGPFGSQLHESDYSMDGIPVIMPKDISNSKISTASIARVSENHIQRLKRHKVLPGDIVYGRRGDIGRHALITDQETGWLCGTGCLLIRLNKKKATPLFIHYYLSQQPIIDYVTNQAIGATMPNLNTEILKKIPIFLPPPPIQRKIAAVLSAYDDLIENNNRRIAILENMAEELYREWFVRLRFPGHDSVGAGFKPAPTKGVPQGWAVKRIGEVCIKVTDGAHASPGFVNDGKFMASVKDMTDFGFNIESMKTIGESDFIKLVQSDCKPLKDDILIAKDGSYLKHVFVWDQNLDLVILSSIAMLRPNKNIIQPYFFSLTLKQESIKSMMAAYVSGSALPRIILNDFKKMQLLVPERSLMIQFELTVKPIYQNIRVILDSISYLTAARDRLLSRLMSGKIDVEHLDIQFPKSMQEEAVANA